MTDGRISVIGAAGEVACAGVERFAAHHPEATFALHDLDPARSERLAARIGTARAQVARLDLFEPEALRRAVEGASLVVLGAGPYMRTAGPVIRACIEAGTDYIDFDDDIESTQDALGLAERARAAGIACLVGCGASPGMSNVMAVDAASRLDAVDTLDVCWVSGDEGRHEPGAAVLDHALHIGAGPCLTWRDGHAVTHESFVETDVFPLGGALGDYRLYETAHPEALTLPRRLPEVRTVRVMGGLHPQPANGMLRGLACAVARGDLDRRGAIQWFQAVHADDSGSLAGWRHALAGMLGQVRRRESSAGALARFLWEGARKRHLDYRGCLLVRATGSRDGAPTTVLVRTPTGGPDTYLAPSMAAVTGTCLAAFATLALERAGELRGVLTPEDWVAPEEFYAALERVGTPRHEILDASVPAPARRHATAV